MNNLWRKVSTRKSRSKSASHKNATQNKPQEPEPEKNETQNKTTGPELVLGKGSLRIINRANLEDGTTTVVEDFRDKVMALGGMDHENLLLLRGYYSYEDEKLLLYGYMLPGRLSIQLVEAPLSWEVRLSIALGAARAIEHLHAMYIYHGNIKSSNVLLMPSSKAQVSDHGLPHLGRPYSKGGADSLEADVYDFGVLLLELLTGKLSTWIHHNEVGRVVDLTAWVRYIIQAEGISAVFDRELKEWFDDGKRMVELLTVAQRCVSSNSHERLRMSEVRRKIEELCSSREPLDGVLEFSERVYVFDYCLTVDGLKNEDHQNLIGGVVGKVQQHFSDALFMVFNFGEQQSQSQIPELVFDMPAMNYPIHHCDCPILAMEIIHHFLRAADGWLSLDEYKNMLLMHCERGGWPVLAFMLAALLL